MKKLDELCINTIRTLTIDAIQKANSGHPGMPMGAAPMAYVLWNQFLKHNPKNPLWYNRDRFILSAGHGSMLLYSLLHLTGYPLALSQLKNFRQWHSLTPGHPERELTAGVEVSTGPLGQGFANGIGIAIAQAYLAAHYNRPGFNIIDYYTYAIVSDGDLMEGVTAEAASLAGHLKLGKVIYLYDDNRITLSSSTQLAFTEEVQQRFKAYGWHTQVVKDGNDLKKIGTAIQKARAEKNKPSLILIRTQIGHGSPRKQGTYKIHGAPLGEEEIELTKHNLKWPLKPKFYIPAQVKKHFQKAITSGKKAENQWNKLLKTYAKKFPDLYKELHLLMRAKLRKNWDAHVPFFPADPKGMATRDASGKVMNAIGTSLPGFIGGSADLNESTKTALTNLGNFEHPSTAKGDLQGAEEGGWNYAGRNIFYGVREHAMGAISNGIATVKGMLPYAATFLTFSDYMRPPIRLAALSKLHVVFVFTHDSIGVGEDGPTHQPIEHIASLRAIPDLIVIRPADANETAVAWEVAIETENQPIALLLTRQKVPTLDRTHYASAEGLCRGAYILEDAADGKPELILIATGSEVSLIVAAKEKLKSTRIRLVSMPSWELFEKQSQEYQDSVLPPLVTARLVVEAGIAQGWERYAGEQGKILSIENYGQSAPGEIVLEKNGFTVDHVYQKALALLK